MFSPSKVFHYTVCTYMSSGLQWAQSMVVATMSNKRVLFVTLMGCAERFKAHIREFFANFDLSITLRSCSSAYRCQDLAILVMTIDSQNRLLYPLHMHVGYCIVRAQYYVMSNNWNVNFSDSHALRLLP